MIFSSPEFILLFLPVSFFVYFLCNKFRFASVGKAWLVAVSLAFYAYWDMNYLPLLLASIVFNFAIGNALTPSSALGQAFTRTRIPYPLVLAFAICCNLALLGYFKYTNFLIDNLNAALDTKYVVAPILLPLGISFFTFTQIAYLVDSYRGEAKEYDLTNYALFVTFFPHLIAGPILHHREMMSQFKSRWNLVVRYRHILLGLFIFSIGLFKKVIVADTFAIWANAGFDDTGALDFFSAWACSLSYTFQLYFDFSGYCDMAVGASLLFNIWLPINFNSPYKALNIQDFWRRWHITLSRFLRDYLYIPLGGNRGSSMLVFVNLMATFVLGGLWHGASWMFVIWGALHGAALVLHRMWGKLGIVMPKALAWLLTFGFVNVTWVFFRAKNGEEAMRILKGMSDLSSILNLPISTLPTTQLAWAGALADYLLRVFPAGLVVNGLSFAAISVGFIILKQKNSQELMYSGISKQKLSFALLLFAIAMMAVMASTSSVFLYFNF